MGLDVSFYKIEKKYKDQELMKTAYDLYYSGELNPDKLDQAEELKEMIQLIEKDDESVLKIWNLDQFTDHALPLKQGHLYKGEYVCGFDFGSYSGYGVWRDELCKKVLGVEPREVWNNPETYREQPFYWLINFADNEGFIAGDSFKKLKDDFKNHDPTFDQAWQNEKYSEWKACVAQADGVNFH